MTKWLLCACDCAGDHIAVLPTQHHLKEQIEALATMLGLASGEQCQPGQATIDTPFDLELIEGQPAGAVQGLAQGYASP